MEPQNDKPGPGGPRPESKAGLIRRSASGVALRPGFAHGVVTIVAAAGLSGAMFSSSQALDSWQDALRRQIVVSAAMQEDVRYTYEDEAAHAWDIDVLEVLATGLSKAAHEPGAAGAYARLEGQSHSSTAGRLRAAYRGTDTLLGSDRYELAGGGQDLPRRLADLRARAAPVSADAARDDGDASFRRAGVLAGAVVSLILGYLLTFLIIGLWARRRPQARGADLVDVRGTLPGRDTIASTLTRFGGVIPLVAWVAVTTLPAVQMHYTKQEQRARIVAASQAVRVSTAIACSGMRRSFSMRSEHEILTREATSLGKQMAALDATDPEIARVTETLALAIEPAWVELSRIQQVMSRAPTTADGVDPATAETVGASGADIELLGAQQVRSADLAGRSGRKADLLSLAMFFAALAGAARAPGAAAIRFSSLTAAFALAGWALLS